MQYYLMLLIIIKCESEIVPHIPILFTLTYLLY